MKNFVILLGLLILCLHLTGQNYSISGIVVNKNADFLVGTNVQLLSDPGNKQLRATVTGIDGKFTMNSVQAGKFNLKITYIGYSDLVKEIVVNQNLSLGKLVLKSKNILLKDAVIKGEAPTAVVKGDTTEINAASYKVNPDATTQDLVTKMPGVTVDNGTVKAQGEQVQKVLVDGKQFYGDDPSAVLRNLPAEVVDKVQIFDKKSDQSEFTGFDDGNTTKTMNIVTRQNYRNGKFGRVFAGGGIDDVWKAGGTYNVFQGDKRYSIIGQSNNINDQNFSIDDFLGTTGGGANAGRFFGSSGPGGPGGFSRSGMLGGGGLSNFLVNTTNGITKTNAVGMNFNNKGKKLEFTGSYFLNYTDNTNLSDLLRQYFTAPNTGLNYMENNNSGTSNSNHRANFRIEYQIDTMNSFLFQPRISLQHTTSKSGQTGLNSEGLNTVSNTNNSSGLTSNGINLSTPLLLRHKFFKKGRTVSLNLNPSYTESTAESHLNTYSNYYSDTLSTADSVNQAAHSFRHTASLSSNLNYTEPLAENTQLQFSYGTTFYRSSSDKKTRSLLYPADTGTIDTSLSNVFKTKYQSQNGGVSLRKRNEKLNLVIGLNYQQTNLKNDQAYPEIYYLNMTFQGFLPNAMLQFRFTKQKSLRINYNTSFNIPSVDQLQRVINNNNPLQLSTGNPDLKPEYQHSLNVRYATSNTETLTSFFIFMNTSLTQNNIGNSTFIASHDTLIGKDIFLARGSQLTIPANLKGTYNLRCFANYSFQLGFMKSKLNLNTSVNYSNTPGMINGSTNFSDVLSSGLGFVLSSNISENFDFTVSSTSTYNNNTNTLQTSANSKYYQQNSRARVNVMPWKGLVIQSDVNHIYYSAFGTTADQRSLLWNGAFGYKFLANKQAELRFSVYDILGQNKNISRNYTDTYYEEARNNVMQRYYMLTFAYTIRTFNIQNMIRDRMRDREFRPPGD